MSAKRWIVTGLLLVVLAGVVAFDLHHLLNLATLKARHAALLTYTADYPMRMSLLYVAAFVGSVAVSLPAAGIMTLAGGALFGLWWGSALAVIAATVGATIALLVSRFLLHDAVQHRFGDRLHRVNRGIARDGTFYVFSLRLVPLLPFFVINLVMGLTPIRAPAFAAATLVGMIPITMVVVNAGTQLARIESLDGILSPALIASLALIAAFPLLARQALAALNARRHPDADDPQAEEI